MKESQGGVREFAVTPLVHTLVFMPEDPRDPKDQCEVVEARHVEDSIGTVSPVF